MTWWEERLNCASGWLDGQPSAPTASRAWSEPEHYDQENARSGEDIGFWVQAAISAPGPVVEIGCGTGRISRDLVRAGCEVIAVDVSPRMIEAAQRESAALTSEERARLRLVQSDVRDLELEPGIAGVTLAPYFTMNYMVGVVDQLRAAAELARVTRPGGKAWVELAHFPLDSPYLAPVRPLLVETVKELEDGARLLRSLQVRLFPDWNMTNWVEVIDVLSAAGAAERRLYSHLWHVFTVFEACYLFMGSGFRVETILGGVDESPFLGGSSDALLLDLTKLPSPSPY